VRKILRVCSVGPQIKNKVDGHLEFKLKITKLADESWKKSPFIDILLQSKETPQSKEFLIDHAMNFLGAVRTKIANYKSS
jgi:hypothetical protein